MGAFFKFLSKYSQAIFIILLFLVLLFGWKQCNDKRELEAQVVEQAQINTQNIQALADSETKYQLTKDELALVNSKLSKQVNLVDSLLNSEVPEADLVDVVVTEPEYVKVDVVVDNTITKVDSTDYVISFSDRDEVRTIEAETYLKIKQGRKKFKLTSDGTKIKNFGFNFDLAVATYKENNLEKVKVFAVNRTTNEQIPDSVLKLNVRGIELLDKPLTLDPVHIPAAQRFNNSGWGFSINPIGFSVRQIDGSYVPVYTPNISFGYYFGWSWKKQN